MINITLACPVALMLDAGQLARVIGYSAADELTFELAPQLEVNGSIYAVASGVVAPEFVTDALLPLVEPPHGADMAAAARAQAAVEIWQEDQPITLGKIIAIVGRDPPDALAILTATAPL